MQTFPIFKQKHEDLLRELTRLSSLINEEQLADKATASLAHQKLCQIMVSVKTHLIEEDNFIYPPLLTHADPKLKTIAWNFIGNRKFLTKAVDEFLPKLQQCQYEFDPPMVKDTRVILDLLCKRFENERDVLFPEFEALDVNN